MLINNKVLILHFFNLYSTFILQKNFVREFFNSFLFKINVFKLGKKSIILINSSSQNSSILFFIKSKNLMFLILFIPIDLNKKNNEKKLILFWPRKIFSIFEFKINIFPNSKKPISPKLLELNNKVFILFSIIIGVNTLIEFNCFMFASNKSYSNWHFFWFKFIEIEFFIEYVIKILYIKNFIKLISFKFFNLFIEFK